MKTDQPSQMNELITNQSVKPLDKQVSRRRFWQITLLSSFLSGLTLAVITLHFVSPTVPGRAESFPARAGWYLTHGQWQPDSRTLAAAWSFWMQTQDASPGTPSAPDLPIAVTPKDDLPES